jgi:Hemolysins and related proteins containing CBS domains
MWGLQLGVMVTMIVLNGILAAFEIALASASLGKLQSLADSGRRGAKASLRMKQKMEGSLAVVQLGITLVGFIAGATAGVGAEEQLAPYFQEQLGVSGGVADIISVLLVVIPLTAVMIVFGELIPKVFALRNPELVLLNVAPVMNVLSYLLWPLVWCLEMPVQQLMKLLESVTASQSQAPDLPVSSELQELRASVAIARTSRLIGSQQEKIILGAAELSWRPVKEIMLPAEFISMIDLDCSAGDALVTAHMDMHTRFPVTERHGDPQGIVGYVIFKDIVAHLRFSPKDTSIRNIVRKINRYSEDLPIAQVLERLIHQREHIALVCASNGKIVGMVTMEDMLEQMVGEIEDEYDRLPNQLVATGRGWIVGGGLLLASLERRTGIKIPQLPKSEEHGEIRTVNDWITAQIDGPIHGSEVIETPEFKMLVRKTRRHNVMEAYLSPKSPFPPPLGDGIHSSTEAGTS